MDAGAAFELVLRFRAAGDGGRPVGYRLHFMGSQGKLFDCVLPPETIRIASNGRATWRGRFERAVIRRYGLGPGADLLLQMNAFLATVPPIDLARSQPVHVRVP